MQNPTFKEVQRKLRFNECCKKYFDDKSCSFFDVFDILAERINIMMDESFPCALFTKNNLRPSKYEEFKIQVETSLSILKNSYTYVASGQRYKALEIIYNHYFSEGIESILEEIPSETPLYRMRSSDYYPIYEDEEMFHVPFEKNFLLSNQRYSISGFPSLYCASSVYCCWLEMGRPHFEKANIALYKIQNVKSRELFHMNTESKDEVIVKCINVDMEESENIVNSQNVKWLLLFSICDLRVKETEHPFVPEYVIPQLLLECVVRYIHENNINYILGVKYKSVKRNDERLEFFGKQNSNLFYNYVFPPYKYTNKGTCEILKRIFKLQANTSWFYLNNVAPSVAPNVLKPNRTYDLSSFRKIETYLSEPQILIDFKKNGRPIQKNIHS